MIKKNDILKKSFSDFPLKRVTCEGYPLVIKDAVPGYLKDYTIYGNEGGVGDLVTDENDENYGKYKISIVNRGKNLLDIKYFFVSAIGGSNGITFIDNKDGTITLNGTATKETVIGIIPASKYLKIPTGNYVLSGGTSNVYLQGKNKADANFFDMGKGAILSLVKDMDFRLNVRVKANTTLNNFVVKPQLEEGFSFTNYEAYRESEETNFFVDKPLEMFEMLSFNENTFNKLRLYEGTNIIECININAPEKLVYSYNKYTKRESL